MTDARADEARSEPGPEHRLYKYRRQVADHWSNQSDPVGPERRDRCHRQLQVATYTCCSAAFRKPHMGSSNAFSVEVPSVRGVGQISIERAARLE
jgi:hypothetical protein